MSKKIKVHSLTGRITSQRMLQAFPIKKLNRVIRGTANYFATQFSTCRWLFQKLDSWIRMRLRCRKLKRKNYNDNKKLRAGFFRRKLSLLTREEFCTYRDARGEARRVIPRNGATLAGVAR
jgi:RNA-directed DNA polymerase